MFIQIVWGLLISGLIGWVAWRRGSLDLSGVIGAVIIGTLILGLGGWTWGAALIAFFVSSSLLSHYKARIKESVAEKFAKGHQRDWAQTMANGSAGALMALAFALWPHPALLAAFAGAMAAVNADTWATELGVLARRPPRLITRPTQIVEPGTSGGISLPGTLASLGGALLIGLVVLIGRGLEGWISGAGRWSDGVQFLLPTIVGGLGGSLFDSLLGATVQAIYYSPNRCKETEKRIDPDGSPNIHQRGWVWMNNDLVNWLSSLAGAALAVGVWLLI